MNRTIVRYFSLALLAVVTLNSPTIASTLQIFFSGVDIEYDGSSIFDAEDPALAGGTDTSKADRLETIAFLVDGSQVGVLVAPPTGTDDIFFDLEIPEVTGLPLAGGSVITDGDPAGTLELLMPGVGLTLELGEAGVSYVPLFGGSIEFAFVGSIASITGQSLPFSLELGDPVSVSLSTQIDISTLTHDTTFVTGFSAAGTGEVSGPFIPEPSCMLLAATSVLLLSRARERKCD